MQTILQQDILATPQGQAADQILRNCVHCGFCNAVCPTYQLLGNELDGPRGRIYLIKQLLEGENITQETQLHLDRCLTCLSCETTCPSGVKYSQLLEIGRNITEAKVKRSFMDRFTRFSLRQIIPYRWRVTPLLKLAQFFKFLYPKPIQEKIPPQQKRLSLPKSNHTRKVILFQGCIQAPATPNTNIATSQILDKLGISTITVAEENCCGALSLHLGQEQESLAFIKRNIDAWWPYIEQGIEAIIITASGCGVTIKDYYHLLQYDKDYADKAEKIASLAKDLSEVLIQEDLSSLKPDSKRRVAFHSACSLQHGQRLYGSVENILEQVGYTLTQVPDSHLCCGSAGTYSILQPDISEQLLANKLVALESDQPDIIATSNIGCQVQLLRRNHVPVVHWTELLI